MSRLFDLLGGDKIPCMFHYIRITHSRAILYYCMSDKPIPIPTDT